MFEYIFFIKADPQLCIIWDREGGQRDFFNNQNWKIFRVSISSNLFSLKNFHKKTEKEPSV